MQVSAHVNAELRRFLEYWRTDTLVEIINPMSIYTLILSQFNYVHNYNNQTLPRLIVFQLRWMHLNPGDLVRASTPLTKLGPKCPCVILEDLSPHCPQR